jgi:hypothetical protein
MIKFFFTIILSAYTISLLAQNNSKAFKAYAYDYISPLPGSSLIPPENNVIIRSRDELDRQKIRNNFIIAVGSKSGNHEGELIH